MSTAENRDASTDTSEGALRGSLRPSPSVRLSDSPDLQDAYAQHSASIDAIWDHCSKNCDVCGHGHTEQWLAEYGCDEIKELLVNHAAVVQNLNAIWHADKDLA